MPKVLLNPHFPWAVTSARAPIGPKLDVGIVLLHMAVASSKMFHHSEGDEEVDRRYEG
jgi:hypothetical protein